MLIYVMILVLVCNNIHQYEHHFGFFYPNPTILSSTHPGTAVGGVRAWRWKYWLGPYLFIAKLHIFTRCQQRSDSSYHFQILRQWERHFYLYHVKFSAEFAWQNKIHAIEFCDFIKDFVVPNALFVPCLLTVLSTWRPRLTAHCQSESIIK